jgi:NAD(P)-dependent dehydrogenase (short-subunit alcohol dehydrogenase family)
LVDAALPSLAASDSGAVVAIGTTNAIETAPPAGANSYGAFKAAVIQHASALGHTLAPQGIRVNTVSPGPVWFPGGVWEGLKAKMPELYERVLAAIPLGSMATDDDVANAVVFLRPGRRSHHRRQPRCRRQVRRVFSSDRGETVKPGGRIDAVVICGGRYHDFDYAR